MTKVLEVQGITKRFGRITVADGLSLGVGQAECLGIIGPNGAGKTSLFNMIDGSLRPESGQILLDGQDITRRSTHDRVRDGLARAYQIPQPFGELTAFENVLLAATFGAGLPDAEGKSFAHDVLERTGLTPRARSLAGGLGLLDRKRLELARAMATRPRLLLLDEVAGGLTQAEVASLIALIDNLKSSVAIVWIEHVTHALLAVADRVLALHNGVIIAEGLPGEVMRHPAVQEVYMGATVDGAA